MARIRSIKPDLFLDDGLSEVSLEAHFLLAGLPCLADSAGRLEDRPRRIQAQIFPYRPTVDVGACLSELVRSGHIHRYEARGGRYIQVENWDADQRPHVKEAASSIPPPADSNEHRAGTGKEVIAPGTRRELAGTNPLGSGILGVGSEIRDLGSGDLPPPAVASAASGQEGFPEFVWADDAPPEKPTRPAKKPREKKPETSPADPKPYTAACDMLTRVYAEVRKADYGFGLDAPRNGKAVRELLWGAGAKAGEERGSPLVPLEELERRWRIGLAWKGFPACNAIWDLHKHWAAYGQPQQESARAPPVLDVRRGGVRAELMDHTKPQEPF